MKVEYYSIISDVQIKEVKEKKSFRSIKKNKNEKDYIFKYQVWLELKQSLKILILQKFGNDQFFIWKQEIIESIACIILTRD